MKTAIRLIIVLSLFLTVYQSANPVKPGKVEVALISEMTQIKPGQTQWFALTQKIEPGWHTYWRNPGDSGAATSLTWNLPDGFEAGPIKWPVPEAIPYGPLMNYGYHDQVILPVSVSIPADFTADSLVIRVKAEWLVCEDICIPEEADLVLTLPVSHDPLQADPLNVGDFAQVRRLIPQDIEISSSYLPDGDHIEFDIHLPKLQEQRIQSVRYFPYGEGLIDNSKPQVFSISHSVIKLRVTRGYEFDADKAVLDGILVIEEDSGENLSVSFEIFPSPGSGQSGAGLSDAGEGKNISTAEVSLLMAIALAFLGGMILNLMPCVFPVLSIKVLSLMKHKEITSREMRFHGLVYLVGVVLSFVLIAAILMLLRAGGAQIGWGFQLQSPIVVALLAYLFFVIGLNLSGVFQIGMGVMNLGGSFTDRQGYSGSFFTGVLATLVAAPCTAPFMGAAIGFALTQSSLAALLVFASLGVGMALPYVALCYSPGLIKKLPKAGSWMEGFKEFLAFPMYASAVWLVWVLSLQSGSDGVLMVLTGALLITLAIWLMKDTAGTGFKKALMLIAGAVLIVTSIALPFGVKAPSASIPATGSAGTAGTEAATRNYQGPAWQIYSPALLTELRSQGPVFVNFTAAWCITCKVNEIVALSSSGTSQVFSEAGISYLKGDWTNEDPVITAALAEYGRSGVPLYLMYSQGSGRAEVLPQILTEEAILDAVSRARTVIGK